MSKKNRERREQNRAGQQQSPDSGQIAQESKTRWKLIVALLVIIIAPIVTYWNSLEGEFHFDDYHAIVENPNIKSFDRAFGLRTRFVTDVSLAIDYSLGKLDTRYYHAQQIFWHMMNCVLIFFILRFTLKRLNQQNIFIPFATALLFAVHPLNSEPVNYLIQRSMVLGTFFYLASLLFFILAFSKEGFKKALYFTGCLITFILAIFTKETFATLPIVLLFYFIYFIKPSDISTLALIKKLGFRFWIACTAFFAIIFAYMVYLNMFRRVIGAFGESPFKMFCYNFLTQLSVTLKYISLMFMPLPSRLNVDHSIHEVGGGIFTMDNIVSIIIISCLVYTIVKAHKLHKILSFGVLWLLIVPAATSLVPRIEVMVEYRNYSPILGFLMTFSYLVYAYSERLKLVNMAKFFIAILAIMLAFLTIERNRVWESELTLWSDSAEKAPYNPRAYTHLASFYLQTGNYDKALEEGKRALEINPNDKKAHHNYISIGLAYLYKKNYDEAEHYLTEALKFSLSTLLKSNVYEGLGILYGEEGNYSKSFANFEFAIREYPSNARIYYNYSYYCKKSGQYEKEKELLKKVIELDPDNKNAYIELGGMLAKEGDKNSALEYLNKALAISADEKTKALIKKVIEEIQKK